MCWQLQGLESFFKRETKAELSPVVRETMKCFSVPHCRAVGIYQMHLEDIAGR